MTRAGQLKESVTLQRRALDEDNERLGEWGEDVVRDARIVYLRGGEPVLEARLRGVTTATITVRAGGDPDVAQVDNGWRAVTREGRVFNILAALPHESGDFVDFTAQDDGTDGGA